MAGIAREDEDSLVRVAFDAAIKFHYHIDQFFKLALDVFFYIILAELKTAQYLQEVLEVIINTW